MPMQTHQRKTSPPADREGSVLFLIMGLLAALSFIGATIFIITKTDLRITSNFKTSVEAFQQADGGIQYVKSQIDREITSGTLTLVNPVETVNYTAPPGFNFDPVTELTRLGNTNAYVFKVTGRSMAAETTIEAVVHRRPLMQYGVFGDQMVDIKSYAEVYSYHSGYDATPTPSRSDGSVSTASNEEFLTGMGTVIDGDLALGTDPSGTPGVWNPTGDPVISGEEGVEVGRIEPDPLGAVGGDLAQEFTDASSVNDNGSANPPIPVNNRISLGNGDSMTLTAGNYYVEDLELKQGATLNIDSTGGRVTIYLVGRMEAKAGSAINMTGPPTAFSLFSNSTQDIILKNSGTLQGEIYAPEAFVEVKNNGDFYGTIWGETVDLKNSGILYVDAALIERRWDSTVYLASWKEVRR